MKKLTDAQIDRITRISDCVASIAAIFAFAMSALLFVAVTAIGVAYAVREWLL